MSGQWRRSASGSLASGTDNGEVSVTLGYRHQQPGQILHFPATRKTWGCTLNPLARFWEPVLGFLVCAVRGPEPGRTDTHVSSQSSHACELPVATSFSRFLGVLNYVLFHSSLWIRNGHFMTICHQLSWSVSSWGSEICRKRI